MSQLPLPLWNRVIFVDWHGVLSRDPFWTSILNSDTHRLKTQLQAKLGDVLRQPICHQWMKGYLSSKEIIEQMGVELPSTYHPNYLRRRLEADCRTMRVNVDLFRILGQARKNALVAIATDNMDCFKDAFERARHGPRRARHDTTPAELMRDWATSCDAIICSSDVQALKAEDPHSFFGPYLRDHGLTFADAALIDDRPDNCDAFAAAGGTPLPYKMNTDHVHDMRTRLMSWLAGTPHLDLAPPEYAATAGSPQPTPPAALAWPWPGPGGCALPPGCTRRLLACPGES